MTVKKLKYQDPSNIGFEMVIKDIHNKKRYIIMKIKMHKIYKIKVHTCKRHYK